ncbi:unnamed protein product [Rangifer tarandus platyrhynchus]|uniref:HSF-type DNA-binding domain-containing protein n=9 Tax=Rangifer tarandus platyrhynchus TaxID=3082113 RepID=A0ABN8XS64_RANTA|nr:unnamed protein product [Rangifer tarandus platyrhynchus]CAI9150952.1 unnamed protein product [Rangifer tarandus platyrhynchus]CAI9150953.1 unnamed protein product [Rangifer tarandus platyrhynchus]CAI9150954.1 unnamed protein product [Rangifer tarandus platyrhynchus]CAI9181454.1 unnamed protein product [Rangifer tarandus platyrhynchus]
MASQSSHKAHAALLAPLTYGEPVAGDPHDSSPDPNVDSGEALEKQGDQPESPDPGLHDNLLPQGPKPEMANKEENNAVLGLSFPRKLWRIVEDAAFTSVRWNDEGDMVVIEADLFQTEVLQRRGADQIFETASIKSFIRELNLYGFSKIRPSCHSAGKKTMIYRNSNFQRDKPCLLQNIPKRKKRVMATRHSPRLHHNQCTQEAGKKVQKGTPPARRTLSRRSFVLSRLWSMGSVAGRAGANHLPSEQGGPSGKGMSSNTTFVPPATSGRESTGQMPESPPEYPDYDSVMALHNTCYSILTAALSSTAPNEAPEAEEEQGEYMCVLCEHVKDKPNL